MIDPTPYLNPNNVAAWAVNVDMYPAPAGQLPAALMAMPESREVPGQLWERAAERGPSGAARDRRAMARSRGASLSEQRGPRACRARWAASGVIRHGITRRSPR